MRLPLRPASLAAAALLPQLLLAQSAPPTGRWHATLEPVPGLAVAFDLKVEAREGKLTGSLVNGASESRFTSVSWDGESLTLELAHYDAKLVARREGDALAGTFTRTTASGKIDVPLRATRVAPALPKPPKGAPALTGDWGVEMGEGPKAERLLATFRQDRGRTSGTLLGSTGDYGPMHGTYDGKALVLTVFDGVFIYRLDGTLDGPDALSGTFRTRSGVPTPWKARRLDARGAASWLPGGGSIVRAKDPDARLRFAFPAEGGRVVSLDDPDLTDKPVVISISGTWCPNCNDEAPVLEALYRRYHGEGLAVVALSYEYTEDAQRSFRQIARFRERHGITFPILFAGVTKSAAATEPISRLDGWEGYPTTLFLDRSHRIVKAHSGFDGPSTGPRFAAQKKSLEAAIQAILAR